MTRLRRPSRLGQIIGLVWFAAALIGLVLVFWPMPDAPSRIVHTANSVDAVAACLGRRPGNEVVALSLGRKKVLVRNGRRGILEVFTLIPEGTGSIVEDRHQILILGGPLSLEPCAPARA